MYICVCHAVNERSVRQAIAQGYVTVSALRECLGFKSSCGKCTPYLKNMINESAHAKPLEGDSPILTAHNL